MSLKSDPTLARATLGVALAGAALWATSGLLTGVASRSTVAVAAPGAVARGDEPWRAEAGPPEELARLEVLLDGAPQGDSVVQPSGAVEVPLAGLAPGYHQIELRTRRRGDRVHSVMSSVLVGPFAARVAAPEERRCGLSAQISTAALERVLLPVVRERLLAATRSVELLGPATRLERFVITPTPGGVRFDVALAGRNRVEVHGALAVAVGRRLELRLRGLDEVEFTGELRTKATVGGAAVGAVVTGPLAPLGAVAGYLLTDRYIDGRARDEVQRRLEQALRKLDDVELIPERAELIPGEPRSRVALAPCERGELDPARGVTLRLAISPDVDASALRELASPGPVDHGVRLPDPAPLPEGTDVQLDLSIDAVNALLDAWTAAGLLEDRVADAGLLARANESLAEWTTLQLRRVGPRLPPALAPATDEGWSVSIGELELELDGVDTSKFSAVTVGGLGRLWPHFDEDDGTLRLAGELGRLWLSCERADVAPAPDASALRIAAAVVREPCFGAMLEVATFDEKLNRALAPGSGRLPALDVRGLLRRESAPLRPGGLELERLWSEHPEGAPGVLRVRAAIR